MNVARHRAMLDMSYDSLSLALPFVLWPHVVGVALRMRPLTNTHSQEGDGGIPLHGIR